MTVEAGQQPYLRQGGLFAGYNPPSNAYDEVKDPSGRIRPHWAALVAKLEGLGPDYLKDRHENAQQLLRDHGVTFNVYADGQSAQRPWKLDLLPMVISGAEWAKLEAGLTQRAHLLDRVLADIYGPQRLLKDGLLSPALVHANPGFLRQCHGIQPPAGRFLSLHAVDLTRAPNGEWWVLGDRTQCPSGVGYALENRIILSRVLSEEFRTANVHRVASYFIARKAGLRSLATWTPAAQTVLLSPGPYSSTYFEHAYLARYLGYPLVEGNDLTVRDRRVYMKTLEGLQPVDVILRRVDETFCDPLEMRADSFLGVPGLVEAFRAGNVAISNPFGCGAVEAPALLAFLPALSRHLLGEELKIPNVATWWCGQERERAYTFQNLHALVVKRAFVRGRGAPIFGEYLGPKELNELADRIRNHPSDFVGQERVAHSTVPVWTGERLEPRPFILRCFVTASADGYCVFPGGLTRLAPSPDSPIVTSAQGGGSKDTWITASSPVAEITLLESRSVAGETHRTAAMVPSRVLDNLFWLGRYTERFESQTRLLRTILSRVAGESGPLEEAELAVILRAMVHLEQFPSRFVGRVPLGDLFMTVRAMVFDPTRVGSMRDLLDRIGFLTASLRDRFSGDMWRILHQLQADFPTAPLHFTVGNMLTMLHRLIFQLAAFSGMEMENMARGHAWHFLQIGRRLERALNLLSTIRAIIASESDGGAGLVPLLEYSDSTMTYRRRYFARPELPGTLDLLISDPSNPRGVMFQVNVLTIHLSGLPDSTELLPERVKLQEICDALGSQAIWTYGRHALQGRPEPLEGLLDQLTDNCRAISDALTIHYFNHVQPEVS